jgi:chromatin structure-remodeling complex subunit RSC1/2
MPQYYNAAQPGQARASVGAHYPQHRSSEVYTLNDAAQAAIPEEVRDQFQRDDDGRILFFAAPPIDTAASAKDGKLIGHSTRYLAEKRKRTLALEIKRRKQGSLIAETTSLNKKLKVGDKGGTAEEIERLMVKALGMLTGEMADSMISTYKQVFGERWKEAMNKKLGELEETWTRDAKRQKGLGEETMQKESKEKEKFRLFLDDVDPRY